MASVVMANENPVYREALALMLRQVRPQLPVQVVEPESVEGALASLAAQVVISSRLTAEIRARASFWISLYPDGATWSEVRRAAQYQFVADLQMNDLLDLIDEFIAAFGHALLGNSAGGLE